MERKRVEGRFFHYLVHTVHDIYIFVTGTRRVRANEVYQEYIKDKNHYHMNATRVCQYCMYFFYFRCGLSVVQLLHIRFAFTILEPSAWRCTCNGRNSIYP